MTRNEMLLNQIQTLENEAISYAKLCRHNAAEGKENHIEEFKIKHSIIDMMQKTDLLLHGKFEDKPFIN